MTGQPFHRRSRVAVLLLVIVLGMMLGIGQVMAQDEAPLVVNIAVAPSTLDPGWGCTSESIGFIQNFYVRLTQYAVEDLGDGLYQTNPTLPMDLYFATSVDISEDGTVYTFTLPEGYTFPSGTPVDAAAVKYSIDRTLTMDGCGAYFVLGGVYDPYLIQQVDALDATTVQFTLARPEPNFLEALAQPAASIVDPSVVEANGGIAAGEPNEYMTGHVAGSGPFLLSEYEANNRAVLTANPDFFGDAPGSSQIIVNWINADETLLLQARNAEANVTMYLNPQSVASLQGNDAVRIVVSSTTNSQRLSLPNGKAPWDSVKFREAITHAIPYEALLENVAYGYGEIYYGPFSPAFPEYNAELSQPRTFDMELAQQLIAESGVATPVDVELVIAEGNSDQQQIATILQGVWRELGINLTIRVLSSADFTDAVEGHTAQSSIRLDGTGIYDAGYFLGFDMLCGISFNVSEVCIPEADALLEQARVETDDAARQALYDQISELWIANSPFVPLYAVDATTVLSADMTTFLWSHYMDFRRWAK
ncbi:MAG: ABC transporter substrate-binding protein [Anaerolineae bacterium]|nr:ABC transporter substrate-binding protein [Anaerolineae bacterium]